MYVKGKAMSEEVTTLIPEEEIRERIRSMGAQISSDYAGKTVHIIGVLKGA